MITTGVRKRGLSLLLHEEGADFARHSQLQRGGDQTEPQLPAGRGSEGTSSREPQGSVFPSGMLKTPLNLYQVFQLALPFHAIP